MGSRVCVVLGTLQQIAEVHCGRGYQRHFGTRLSFGLGNHDRVERIEIHWVRGRVEVVEDVAAARLLTIVQARARVTRDDSASIWERMTDP